MVNYHQVRSPQADRALVVSCLKCVILPLCGLPTGSEAFLGMAVAGDTGMGSVGGGGSLPGTPFGGMAFPGMPNPAVTSTATTGVPHGMPGAPGFPYGGQLQHGLPVGMGADAAMPVQGPKRKVGRPPKAKVSAYHTWASYLARRAS